MGGIFLAVLIVGIYLMIWNHNINTFQYQYNKAMEDNASMEYEKAIVHLEKAVSYDNSNKDANLLLANLYYQSGKFDLSISI
ncbi:MAG: tetratricopeptide repeat protein [Clostridiales bacterium]|nr:tetratricopeptide repeat protein [Clostridiales bacterium]